MQDTREVRDLRRYLAEATPRIVDSYAQRVEASGNPLGALPKAEIARVILPLVDSVCSADPTRDDVADFVGEMRAAQLSNPMHSMAAANLLYEVMAEVVAEGAEAMKSGSHELLRVLAELHNAILRRVSKAARPYAEILLNQIQTAHRAERRRVARDLHDRSAHAIALALQQIDLRQIALERGDHEAADHHLAIVVDCLHDSAASIEEIAEELGTTQTASGLANALERYIDLHGESRVFMDVSDRDRLDDAPEWMREEFYLAVREGVRNALIHSGSPTVRVNLGVAADSAAFAIIHDNGVGIPDAAFEENSSGTGLVSLYERIQLLGGDLDIKTEPSKGATVELRVPLRP